MEVSRERSWQLLNRYTHNPNLIKHALAVEAAMRAYAERFEEDVEKWGVVGLLHDFDYDRFPEEHPMKGSSILREEGYPEEIVHAIEAHANFTGVPRRSLMDKTLFAVDELCGLVTAATLVRPGKKVAEVPVKSIKKKLKDKAFARSVSREDIFQGVDELGVDLGEHIGIVIQAMGRVAQELGLDGEE